MKYYPYVFQDTLSVHSVISVFNLLFEPTYSFKGETHNFWECVYVKSGTVGVTADDVVLTLKEGQMIFHKPMEFHRIWAGGGTAPEVVIFSFDCGSPFMEQFENTVTYLTEAQQKLILSIVEEAGELFSEYEMTENHFCPIARKDPTVGCGQALKNYLELLLIQLMRNRANPPKAFHSSSGSALLYNEVIGFLENNIERSIRNGDICAHCHCSESNLKKIFRRYVGTGVMKHFLRLKLNRAAKLLAEGQSINEVSSTLGFSSPYYFSAAFKRELGVAPSRYNTKNTGL